jgi:tRNA (guanine-N7-)-methyltransferase
MLGRSNLNASTPQLARARSGDRVCARVDYAAARFQRAFRPRSSDGGRSWLCDGAFLVALAIEKPHHNFLGIERSRERVRRVCRKAAKLSNVRVLCIDTTYAVAQLIPPVAVSQFHLLFPDPWPKRRHHRRRIVTLQFIAAIHRALVPDGLLHIATDHAEYFQQIKRLTSLLFVPAPVSVTFPQSTFERQFATRELTIHRLLLRKISPVR